MAGEIDKTAVQLVAAPPTNAQEARGHVKVRASTDQRGVRLVQLERSAKFQEDLFADLRRGTGAVIISSSSGDEFGYEGETWNNGVFTLRVAQRTEGARGR